MISLSSHQIQSLIHLIREKINKDEAYLEDPINYHLEPSLRDIVLDQISTYREIEETLSNS